MLENECTIHTHELVTENFLAGQNQFVLPNAGFAFRGASGSIGVSKLTKLPTPTDSQIPVYMYSTGTRSCACEQVTYRNITNQNYAVWIPLSAQTLWYWIGIDGSGDGKSSLRNIFTIATRSSLCCLLGRLHADFWSWWSKDPNIGVERALRIETQVALFLRRYHVGR